MSEDIEVKAKEMGWSPKEEFRGDPDKWVDAESFVRRGEELMPLLKATTKKQSEKIAALEARLTQSDRLLKAATESIEALKETTSREALEKVRTKRDQLKSALAEARREGDVDAELEIQDKLQETTQAIKESEKKPEAKKPDPANDPTQSPEWQSWIKENTWFGHDKRKTALALGIAQDLRAEGDASEGTAFYNKITEEVNKMLGVRDEPTREAASKVEGSSRGSAGATSGRSYADLPSEAKAACDRQSQRVVGEGRAFKTIGDWRKHYVQKYFEE
jgi:hypothetical protein